MLISAWCSWNVVISGSVSPYSLFSQERHKTTAIRGNKKKKKKRCNHGKKERLTAVQKWFKTMNYSSYETFKGIFSTWWQLWAIMQGLAFNHQHTTSVRPSDLSRSSFHLWQAATPHALSINLLKIIFKTSCLGTVSSIARHNFPKVTVLQICTLSCSSTTLWLQ